MRIRGTTDHIQLGDHILAKPAGIRGKRIITVESIARVDAAVAIRGTLDDGSAVTADFFSGEGVIFEL